jgi:curli biogenesis system outer membrane secretion channel CsgG
MLKSGRFQLVQGKPFTDTKHTEKLYDIIARIKQGMYPGADYVLFGSINNIEFRQEANPIDHTNTVSHTLSLELVGEFSLVSTKNYQIKSAFSAMGTGQDVKLMSSAGGRVVLNRGRVISEVSKSLGEDVTRQLEEQLGGIGDDNGRDNGYRVREESSREEVIIFR